MKISTGKSRAVAQPGSALPWGGRGPEFKSRRPDHSPRAADSRVQGKRGARELPRLHPKRFVSGTFHPRGANTGRLQPGCRHAQTGFSDSSDQRAVGRSFPRARCRSRSKLRAVHPFSSYQEILDPRKPSGELLSGGFHDSRHSRSDARDFSSAFAQHASHSGRIQRASRISPGAPQRKLTNGLIASMKKTAPF